MFDEPSQPDLPILGQNVFFGDEGGDPLAQDEEYLIDPDSYAAKVEAMLDDESPTEQQLSFERAGGVIFTKSDRTGEGGIPIGLPPEKVDNQVVTVARLTDKDPPPVSFRLTGRDDAIVREVARKYKLKEGESRDKETHHRMFDEMMREIARKKAESGQSKPVNGKGKNHSTPGVQRVQPNSNNQRQTPAPSRWVDVAFHFGGIDGVRRSRYRDVNIEGNLLILVATEDDQMNGLYEPPNLGPNRGIDVSVQGLDTQLRVFSCGINHKYAGNVFFILFIDRGEVAE